MTIFLAVLFLQILTGYCYTFPGGNSLGQDAYKQPSPPSPPSTPPYEQRMCGDDRVEWLTKLVKSQHEEQMKLLRTLARCRCSDKDNYEYQEYIPHEEEPHQKVPEFPVPAPYGEVHVPYEVPLPYEEVYYPYDDVSAPYYEVSALHEELATPYYEVTAPYEVPVTAYSEPSDVPTAKRYQIQTSTPVSLTTRPPPTRARYQGPIFTTSSSPPPVSTTISPPVPTAKKYHSRTTTPVYTTTSPPPTRSRYQSPSTLRAPPQPTTERYQTQPTATTTAGPIPTRSIYQSPPTTTIPSPAPTATRYLAPSPDDLIPEEYEEARSFSIFPPCDGDCPTFPDANHVLQQSPYEQVSTSYEPDPSTAEYYEPVPVPGQGSGQGNYRTNPRRIFSAVTPVPLPLPDEDLEEIVKELEQNYPSNIQRSSTTLAPSYRGNGQ